MNRIRVVACEQDSRHEHCMHMASVNMQNSRREQDSRREQNSRREQDSRL